MNKVDNNEKSDLFKNENGNEISLCKSKNNNKNFCMSLRNLKTIFEDGRINTCLFPALSFLF